VFRISVFCGFKVNGQREVLHSTVYVDLTTKMYNLRMHAVMWGYANSVIYLLFRYGPVNTK